MPLPQAATDALKAAFGDRILFDEPLARHTSARIGGPADAFLTALTTDDLRQAARMAWDHDIPLRILGGGSNILISDGGIDGLAIHNRADQLTIEADIVNVDSGFSTIQLARQLARRGLAGFEWAIGVPGTIGGAVYGNAGAHGGDMDRCVREVMGITPEQGEVTWSHDDLAFEYRSSRLKRESIRCVILSVEMAFTPGNPDDITDRMQDYNAYRKRTQPPGATIGSMFKNPPGDYAGRLIEAAGLKGTQIGGAQISEKHANFFLNADNATATDVKALVDVAQSMVYDRSGVRLELEVELVGRW